MTHPLTPREKVARCIVGPRNPVPDNSKFTLDHLRQVKWSAASESEKSDALWAADAILTALASGSGDHAGLAMSVGKAIDANIHRTSRLYSVRTGERRYGVGGQAAATDAVMAVVSPLLAENAALRADADRSEKHRNDMADKITSQSVEIGALRSANTEAERKLAEAVGMLRESLAPGSFEGETEINTRIRTFLSREAERGREAND